MLENNYFVYIITNKSNTTLYTGVTNNLTRRIYEHKNSLIEGFSKKYNLQKLVYYEIHNDIEAAIKREKTIKKWPREWKENIIKKQNTNWKDLYQTLK